jgi:hypothetical protein
VAFDAVANDVPSGMPHPDGTQRIHTASREVTVARMQMLRDAGVVPETRLHHRGMSGADPSATPERWLCNTQGATEPPRHRRLAIALRRAHTPRVGHLLRVPAKAGVAFSSDWRSRSVIMPDDPQHLCRESPVICFASGLPARGCYRSQQCSSICTSNRLRAFRYAFRASFAL